MSFWIPFAFWTYALALLTFSKAARKRLKASRYDLNSVLFCFFSLLRVKEKKKLFMAFQQKAKNNYFANNSKICDNLSAWWAYFLSFTNQIYKIGFFQVKLVSGMIALEAIRLSIHRILVNQFQLCEICNHTNKCHFGMRLLGVYRSRDIQILRLFAIKVA